MFSQMFVCPKGGWLASQHASQVTWPGGLHPGGSASGGGRVGGQNPPPRYMGYGQQTGGTHPTGMLSCFSERNYSDWHQCLKRSVTMSTAFHELREIRCLVLIGHWSWDVGYFLMFPIVVVAGVIGDCQSYWQPFTKLRKHLYNWPHPVLLSVRWENASCLGERKWEWNHDG